MSSNSYPPPPVPPDEWEWGRPGSFEDWIELAGV